MRIHEIVSEKKNFCVKINGNELCDPCVRDGEGHTSGFVFPDHKGNSLLKGRPSRSFLNGLAMRRLRDRNARETGDVSDT